MSASRYDPKNTTQLTTAGGQTVVYLQRRLLPQVQSLATQSIYVVKQNPVGASPDASADAEGQFGPPPSPPGERLDTVAAETLGDPELYWRICDANGAMRAEDLEVLLAKLRIPFPPGFGAAAND